MTLLELRTLFRLRAGDTAAPYLWADAEIDGYLNDAENEAAERASLIYDDSSAATSIATVIGTKRYTVAADMIRLDYAELTDPPSTEAQPLAIADRREYGPRAIFLIPDSNDIELNFIPAIVGALHIGMYRMPLAAMALDADVPEIAAKHHRKLIDWALHLAYLKQDADAFDQTKADRHEAEFIANFGQRIDANVKRKQRERRRHVVRCNW
ncbi:MAG: hypothetical protein WA085_12665 [Sphingobium sp.]